MEKLHEDTPSCSDKKSPLQSNPRSKKSKAKKDKDSNKVKVKKEKPIKDKNSLSSETLV